MTGRVYEVTAPDGKVYEITAPEGATEAQALEFARSQLSGGGGGMPRQAQQAVSWANQAIAAVPDAVLNTPTNIWNLGKAGVGTVANALGRPDLAPELTPNPDYVSRGFEAAGLTNKALDPTTTGGRLAKAGVQGLTIGAVAPSQAVKQTLGNMGVSGASSVTGQGVAEATGSPVLGTAATMATAPGLSMANNAVRQSSLKTQSQNSLRDQTLADARKEGYVVPPSAAGGNWFTRRLESIAGKAAIGQESAVRNQKVTNDIARREVGIADDQPISVSALEARRKVLAEPYREIASINKQTAATLEELKLARSEATSYWKHYDVSADPKSLAEARKLSAKADALELQIEQAAKSAMKPDLVKELRAARQAIAKTHDVERALNVATGDVSAPILGKAADRGKLSGGLATAGKFQQGFPAYAKEGERVPTPGVSKSEALMGTLLGVGGYGMAGPAGVGLAALPLLSGPTRSMLMSRPFQGAPSYPGANLPALSDPYLRGILSSGIPQE
jgi:hypothetical protein